MQAFQRAMADLGIQGRIVAADRSSLAPALYLADEGVLVPSGDDLNYVETLLKICRRREIGLVIPLADRELETVARARDRFGAAGIQVLVSSPHIVEICRDRRRTLEFLKAAGLATPEIFSCEEAPEGPFSFFRKPRYGSRGQEAHFVSHRPGTAGMPSPDGETPAVQRAHGAGGLIREYVKGNEFAVDVYAGLDGVPRLAVPRQRLEVRDGEVSKARTVRHPEIIRRSMQLIEALAGCVGVVTIRCVLAADDEVQFIKVTPRFGDGVLLAIRAGADFPRWIIEEHLGRRANCDPDGWQDGLLMLGYDAEVFHGGGGGGGGRGCAGEGPIGPGDRARARRVGGRSPSNGRKRLDSTQGAWRPNPGGLREAGLAGLAAPASPGRSPARRTCLPAGRSTAWGGRDDDQDTPG
jgi:carbamoyl-phosphate synthase large subunit